MPPLPAPLAPEVSASEQSSHSVTVQLPNLNARANWIGWTSAIVPVLMVAGLYASFALAGSAPSLFPMALITSVMVPIGLLAFASFYGPLWERPVTLRRTGGTVFGAPGGPLRAGEGQVTVEREQRRSGKNHYFVYVVSFAGPGVQRTLFSREQSPTRARAFAEGMSRVGGWQMVWRGAEGDEVRSPSELDVPLVDRIRRLGPRNPEEAVADPAHPLLVRPTEAGVAIESPRRGAPSMVVILALAVLAGGIGWAFVTGRGVSSPMALLIPVFFGLLYLAVLLDELAVRRELIVEPAQIRYRVLLFGAAIRESSFGLRRVESLYLEGQLSTWRLVIAGDGFHCSVGRFYDSRQANEARERILMALLGE